MSGASNPGTDTPMKPAKDVTPGISTAQKPKPREAIFSTIRSACPSLSSRVSVDGK
ncbi:MAG TPA: hypothetical protein VG736_01785 [Vicinamibacterales bacterium]|jgi:hypothetical protein|nr:hypothetical protein [Vicinamibacterales bacterium]